jgi:hypothetical protein
VELPPFSRHTDTDPEAAAARPATTTAAGSSKTGTDTASDSTTASDTTPVRPRRDADTATDLPPAPKATGQSTPPPPPPSAATYRRSDTSATDTPYVDREPNTEATPAVTGPKPRTSLLATLGLILGVAGMLLVLSGPLLGYGIGVAGLALVLSLAGIRATGKRHVAGKSDALLGMIFSLGAIVLGVLALTGSLSWLGTDVQPVNSLREWLDAQFANRF